MINKITIENFKGIKDKVEIDFKPITLLFGPNSAGKSSVVQAIHYIKEILERNNTDPGRTNLGGDAIDLGGFANLVHRREGDDEQHYKREENSISIGFGIEEDDAIEPNTYEKSRQFRGDPNVKSLLQDGGYVRYYIEFRIVWDEDIEKPIVKRYDVHINDEFIGRIEMTGWNTDDSDLVDHMKKLELARDINAFGIRPKFNITKINFDHPNLNWSSKDVVDDEEEPPQYDLFDTYFTRLPQMLTKYYEMLKEPLPDGITERELDPQKLMEIKNSLNHFVYYNDYAFPAFKPISYAGGVSSRNRDPVGDNPEIDYDDAESGVTEITNLELTLTQIFTTPVEMLRDALESFRYIGPLRTIPERAFEPEKLSANNSRWSDGLGAWDTVYRKLTSIKKENKEFLPRVNKWMEELQTGYSIKFKEFKTVDNDNPLIMGLNNNGRLLEDGESVRKAFEEIKSEYKIVLFEEKNQIEVSAKDIGSGVAQVFPIIVGCVDWVYTLFAIEQPELHIHPALQQKLSDMIIYHSRGESSITILETHSEHIILRFLRRIQETTNDELPSPDLSLKPEAISVIYIEPIDEGVKINPLPIDESGEFTVKWPGGFFEERVEDIF